MTMTHASIAQWLAQYQIPTDPSISYVAWDLDLHADIQTLDRNGYVYTVERVPDPDADADDGDSEADGDVGEDACLQHTPSHDGYWNLTCVAGEGNHTPRFLRRWHESSYYTLDRIAFEICFYISHVMVSRSPDLYWIDSDRIERVQWTILATEMVTSYACNAALTEMARPIFGDGVRLFQLVRECYDTVDAPLWGPSDPHPSELPVLIVRGDAIFSMQGVPEVVSMPPVGW